MNQTELESRARSLIDATLVWDNHACMPLRPLDTGFLSQLERHRRAGFDVVMLNAGFGEQDIEAHVRMVASLRHWISQHSEHYLMLERTADAEEARRSGRLAVGLDIEGANAIGDQLSLIEMYRDLGVWWMAMAYNRNNRVGGGCQDDHDPGLSEFGRAVIREMERVGMAVCVSHTGHRTAREAIAYASKPVIFSHSNCSALREHPRNIPDELIRACAATGGLVGINGVGIFLGANDIASETYARHIDHVVQLVGPQHVNIALDYVFDLQELHEHIEKMKHTFPPGLGYDLGGRFVPPEQLTEIVAILMDWGYDDGALTAILGGNLMQLMKTIEGARSHV